MAQVNSPVTGILEEDQVIIDFGMYEGKSVYEISDTDPEYYQYMIQEKELGNFRILRFKDKSFRLYIQQALN
ncbi:MAG: hypothetical protein U0T83_09645 [Bacteriovoracaceae bacterium]